MIKLIKPLILNNVLPDQVNYNLLQRLTKQAFHFGYENDDLGVTELGCALDPEMKHMGMTHVVSDKHTSLNNYLDNFIAYHSYYLACLAADKLKINKFSIFRSAWNYYYKDQEGIGHIDSSAKNSISLVYTPTSSDGGTEIDGVFYKDEERQLKIFKSDWKHRGVCVKNNKGRFSLNVVLNYYE